MARTGEEDRAVKKPVKKNTGKGNYEPPSGKAVAPKTSKKITPTGKTDDYTLTRDKWNDIQKRNKGRSGYDARLWMMEELEPYMGSIAQGTFGSGLFPGVKENPAIAQPSYQQGSPRWYGGGGGGGGGLPTPPVPPPMKIRTSTGQRRSPYWSSEDPFIGGFEPRFVVLGDASNW